MVLLKYLIIALLLIGTFIFYVLLMRKIARNQIDMLNLFGIKNEKVRGVVNFTLFVLTLTFILYIALEN